MPETDEDIEMTDEAEGQLSAKEVALELGTDARTFRKFMRATTPRDLQPGQGGRYRFEAEEVDELRTQFKEWAASPKKVKKEKATKVIEIDDDDEVVDLSDVEEIVLDDPDAEDLDDDMVLEVIDDEELLS